MRRSGACSACNARAAAFLLVVLTAVAGVAPLPAQSPAEAPIEWRALPGRAVDLSISANGRAFAVAPDGSVWRWRADAARWSRLSGAFLRIATPDDGRPWAIDGDGAVYRYNGLWWEIRADGAIDVTVAADGRTALILRRDGRIERFNPLRNDWAAVATRAARRLAADAQGRPWVIAEDGAILAFDGAAWRALPGTARDIAIAPNGGVLIAGSDGTVRLWRPDLGQWLPFPGIADAAVVAAAPDARPWAALSDGSIRATATLSAPETRDEPETPAGAGPVAERTEGEPEASETREARRPGFTDPVTVTEDGALAFTDTRATARQVAIGTDGSVFALTDGNAVRRWSNARQRFEPFPGQMARIAVAPDGLPWGINPLGRVFRHDGRRWAQVQGAVGTDIAVGPDGSVAIIDADGRVARLNEAGTRFQPTPVLAQRIALGPDGLLFVIGSTGLIQSCPAIPCDNVGQQAIEIGVGPDGSVFAVTPDNRLLRRTAEDAAFQTVRVAGRRSLSVAVGPRGLPWAVTAGDRVYAAAFFDRDESGDQALALATPADTSGTGAQTTVDASPTTGFVFTKTLQFDTFVTGLAVANDIAIGPANEVLVTDSTLIRRYDAQKEAFVNLSPAYTPQAAIDGLDIDSAGRLWILDGTNPIRLRRRAANGAVSDFEVQGATGSAKDIVIGPDDTVYVAADNGIFRKAADAVAFSPISTVAAKRLAVGQAGTLWIVDPSDLVKEFNGATFENRPLTRPTTAVDVGGGADGTIYIVEELGAQDELRKWNPTNQSWDRVTRQADRVDLEADGRPWAVIQGSANAFRARD